MPDAHLARQNGVPSRDPGGLDDARRRGIAKFDDPRARHHIGRPGLHVENELHPLLAQSDRILGQEFHLILDPFAIEKSPVHAAEIGKTERDLVAANHPDHGMAAADDIVARRVERYTRLGIAAHGYFVHPGKRNMFDLIGFRAGNMTDNDLFYTVIAHGAVPSTRSKIYLSMLL